VVVVADYGKMDSRFRGNDERWRGGNDGLACVVGITRAHKE
jgi:hypothetical protein